MTDIDGPAVAEAITQLTEAYTAQIMRMEAKVDNLEQLLAALVVGYSDVVPTVQAMVEMFVNEENIEAFGSKLAEHKRKLIEALQLGHVDAENQANKFTSVSSEQH